MKKFKLKLPFDNISQLINFRINSYGSIILKKSHFHYDIIITIQLTIKGEYEHRTKIANLTLTTDGLVTNLMKKYIFFNLPI